MAKLKTIFKYTLKTLCALVLVVLTVLTTILITYKPVVHDDSEMYRRGYIKHLEDSIISETGKGSLDTMTLDSVKMNKIFFEIFSEK